ncbi:MAG: peptidase M23 [Rickettsiales bacterium]|nr:peptidase M23 [Rickettsiales bacterium]
MARFYLILFNLTLLLLLTMCGRPGGLAPWSSFPRILARSLSSKKTDSTTTVISGSDHMIQKGQTLYSIAQLHQVPLEDLIQQNNLSAPYVLTVGQTLKIPKASFHIVKPKETLYSISRLYNMDQNTLVTLNNLQDPYRLTIGQKLRIHGTSPKTTFRKRRKSGPKKTIGSTLPQREGQFKKPVTNGQIISRYGIKKGGIVNDGINIKAPLNTPVKAAENGRVVYTGQSIKSFGNLVLIKHKRGWVTAYAHLSKITAKENMEIKRGQVLGMVGKTGFVNSPQLHFEIRKGRKTYDPLNYI